jgi:hypothetical protein
VVLSAIRGRPDGGHPQRVRRGLRGVRLRRPGPGQDRPGGRVPACGALDFAYVDGDHTLRGITIDLVKVFPKIRVGGWVGGDDFSPSIWQHPEAYEPTLVCPFAVYFAEAVGSRIYALPHKQFLMEKTGAGYELVDLTGRYGALDVRSQLIRKGAERSGRARLLAGRIRRRLRR